MRLVLLVLLLAAAACSPVDAPVRCTPGAQYPCLCSPGDYRGTQTCEAGGASYTSCVCPGAPADVLPTDAVVAPDVVQLDAGAIEDRPVAADVVDAVAEDRLDLQPDRAAPLDAPDVVNAPDVVDVVQPVDVRVNCNTGMKLPCSSNEECLMSCAPHHLGYLWCCTAGGECRPQSRGMTCLPR